MHASRGNGSKESREVYASSLVGYLRDSSSCPGVQLMNHCVMDLL